DEHTEPAPRRPHHPFLPGENFLSPQGRRPLGPMQGRAFGEGTVPKPVGTLSRRLGMSTWPEHGERRLLLRTVRFVRMWGTPLGIGLFLGSVGCRSARAPVSSGEVHAAHPTR